MRAKLSFFALKAQAALLERITSPTPWVICCAGAPQAHAPAKAHRILFCAEAKGPVRMSTRSGALHYWSRFTGRVHAFTAFTVFTVCVCVCVSVCLCV